VTDTHIAHERAHVTGTKHVPDQAATLVHMECIAFSGDNAGGILTAVLKHQYPVI
jgi:hypothetical protein